MLMIVLANLLVLFGLTYALVQCDRDFKGKLLTKIAHTIIILTTSIGGWIALTILYIG